MKIENFHLFFFYRKNKFVLETNQNDFQTKVFILMFNANFILME